MPASEPHFRELVENIRDAVWIASPDGGRIIFLGAAFERLWGRKVEEAYASPGLWFDSIHPEDRARVQALFFRDAREGGASEQYRVVRPDGEIRWIRNRAYPVRNRAGQVYRVVGIAEDVTEARQLTERLSYQASHDPLTGLINRTEFERRLHRVFDTTRSEHAEHALCYMDLDKFKVVNDTCGHIAGDELLRQLGELLRRQSRRRDTLARLGGDEFGILMEHCSLGQARRVADQLHRAISEFRFSWENRSFSIGASIGLVPINDASESITAIWSAADSACYAAKNAGRNRVHVVTGGGLRPEQRQGEARWVTRIKEALAEDRFVLQYQPIAPVRDPDHPRQLGFRTMAPGERPARDRARYELLVRMVDDENRIVPPGAFLPAAERYDLSAEIDRWVVGAALDLLGRNSDQVAKLSACFINLSGAAIRDLRFPDFVRERIAAAGVPPRKICFEIAESLAVASLGTTTHFVKSLKGAGCRVALDDFGSGPSAFTYLRHLPVDYLKIDGYFVKGVRDDPVNRVTVKAINDIAHAMGKQTVAKSVENHGTLEVLREIGVDFAQGFGIGRPEPLRDLSHPMGFKPMETVARVR